MPQLKWGNCGRLLLPALTCAAIAVLTPPALAQTMTEAFAYAYNNNPQILAQRALLRATDEGVPQALSNWRPQVSLNAQAGFERAGVATPGVPFAAPGQTQF